MATEASVWRLEVASKIAQTYARHRLVKAVSAYGSAAYGTADDLSDLDLKVYWDAPDLECVYEVASPGASLASHRPHLRGTTEHTETFQNAGLRVGMHHVTVTEFETFTDDVLERCDIDDAKQIELSLMVMERPLFGDRYIDYWKAKAAQYPQPLAEKMVQEHLSFYQRSVLENLVRDSASLALQLHIFCRMAENVVGVLLGLNRIYGSVLNVKLLNGWIAGMRLVPADFLPAINCFNTRGTSPSLVRIAAIIDEVLDLAATHMPTTAAFGAWQRFGMPVPRSTTDAASRLARKIGHHYRRSPRRQSSLAHAAVFNGPRRCSSHGLLGFVHSRGDRSCIHDAPWSDSGGVEGGARIGRGV